VGDEGLVEMMRLRHKVRAILGFMTVLGYLTVVLGRVENLDRHSLVTILDLRGRVITSIPTDNAKLEIHRMSDYTCMPCLSTIWRSDCCQRVDVQDTTDEWWQTCSESEGETSTSRPRSGR
jgi:hypothetical protein